MRVVAVQSWAALTPPPLTKARCRLLQAGLGGREHRHWRSVAQASIGCRIPVIAGRHTIWWEVPRWDLSQRETSGHDGHTMVSAVPASKGWNVCMLWLQPILPSRLRNSVVPVGVVFLRKTQSACLHRRRVEGVSNATLSVRQTTVCASVWSSTRCYVERESENW